jgi:mono/diheme cytochrome c family protein
VPSVTPTLTHTPTPAPTSTNSANTPEQIERGFEVYKQQYCGLCHQFDLAGTAGQFGPTHNGMAVTAEQRIKEAQYSGSAMSAAEYIHESIVNPKVYLVAGYEHTQHHMPAYVHLSENDIDALVQMLLQKE